MLPFDAGTLFATVEGYHRAFWPLQALALAAAAGLVALALRPTPVSGRAVTLGLAAAWLWVGLAWHALAFAAVNFAAPLYAALFVLQGVLLAWAALRGRLAFRFRPGLSGWTGLALAGVAVAGYPLADQMDSGAWAAARVPVSTPCPTALLTLGVLLLAEARRPVGLMLIPAAWTVVAGATGWVLGIGRDQLLPLAGVAALAVALRANRQAPV